MATGTDFYNKVMQDQRKIMLGVDDYREETDYSNVKHDKHDRPHYGSIVTIRLKNSTHKFIIDPLFMEVVTHNFPFTFTKYVDDIESMTNEALRIIANIKNNHKVELGNKPLFTQITGTKSIRMENLL